MLPHPGPLTAAVAAADVFLRINGWSLRRPPMQIHAQMLAILETDTFDIAHLDPWLRAFGVEGTTRGS